MAFIPKTRIDIGKGGSNKTVEFIYFVREGRTSWFCCFARLSRLSNSAVLTCQKSQVMMALVEPKYLFDRAIGGVWGSGSIGSSKGFVPRHRDRVIIVYGLYAIYTIYRYKKNRQHNEKPAISE